MKQLFIYSSIALALYTTTAFAAPTYGLCVFELNPDNKADLKILTSINGDSQNKMGHPYSKICKYSIISTRRDSTTGSSGSLVPQTTHGTPIYTCSFQWMYNPDTQDQPNNPRFLKGFFGKPDGYKINKANDKEEITESILHALNNEPTITFNGKTFPLKMYTFNTWDNRYIASQIKYQNCKSSKNFLLGAIFQIMPEQNEQSEWKIKITTATEHGKVEQTYPVWCEINKTPELIKQQHDNEYEEHMPNPEEESILSDLCPIGD